MEGFAAVALLLLIGGRAAYSGLLVSLSVFAMLSALGGATGYEHAAYFLCIKKPLLTVVVFVLLAGLGYFISQRVSPNHARLATIFSRTAVVVVNFGFWVGSLWGDETLSDKMSAWYFIIGWGLVILAAGIWGAKNNLRWLVTTAATFGAIHLYTHWFEHFEANPLSIIIAGIATIGIAYGLISYNRKAKLEANAVKN